MTTPELAALPYEASVAATTAIALGYTSALRHCGAWRRPDEDRPARAPDEVLSAAAFAQSPLDELFGDGRFGAGSRHVLVEFKRSRDHISSEFAKPRRRTLVGAFRSPTDDALLRLEQVARSGHLLGFGGAKDGIVFGPYLPLVTAVTPPGQIASQSQKSRRRKVTDEAPLSDFARALVYEEPVAPPGARPRVVRLPDEAVWRVGVPLEHLLDYLALVLDPGGTSTLDGEPAVSVAGYWFAADERGIVACAAYHNDSRLAELEGLACEVAKRGQPLRRLQTPAQEPQQPSR